MNRLVETDRCRTRKFASANLNYWGRDSARFHDEVDLIASIAGGCFTGQTLLIEGGIAAMWAIVDDRSMTGALGSHRPADHLFRIQYGGKSAAGRHRNPKTRLRVDFLNQLTDLVRA